VRFGAVLLYTSCNVQLLLARCLTWGFYFGYVVESTSTAVEPKVLSGAGILSLAAEGLKALQGYLAVPLDEFTRVAQTESSKATKALTVRSATFTPVPASTVTAQALTTGPSLAAITGRLRR